MGKLLCIAIPTYNRAQILDRQLEWLSRNIGPHEALCEIVLSDNASPDDTSAVCESWRGKFESRGIPVTVVRNTSNVGPLPNIQQCFELSTARFTWCIGDDDEISDGVLSWVVKTLQADPDLASLMMNFSCTGETTLPRCYDFGADLCADGRTIMGECLRQNDWGLAFLTAHVYRTSFAQAAYRMWPNGTRNEASFIFVTVAVGLMGKVYAAQRVMLKYVTGNNFYRMNARVGLRMIPDMQEVLVRLHRIGFPPALVREVSLKQLWYSKRFLARQLLRNSPRYSVPAMLRLARYLAQIAFAGAALGRSRRPPAFAENVLRPDGPPPGA